MTHQHRIDWLREHGWVIEPADEPCSIAQFGPSFWFDEQSGTRSLWLRQSDGAAIIHGSFREVLTWEQLKAWILGTDKPAEQASKKVLPGQRSLFGEDEE